MNQRKRRIVLVEDNEVIRIALGAVLRHAGFNVAGEARDGEAGVELVERVRPDLVCLDVVMPKLDGLGALLQIRTRFPQVKVLMVTGQTDRESVENMIRHGAHGIVVKPFNEARVIETVERALSVGSA
jgi:two-component system chemotaxis response regulator CheY